MAQWTEPAIIINNESSVATNKQQVNNININKRDSNEFLTQPLLDGGQGKANGNDKHTLLQPRGDINHGTHNQGTECQQLPHEWDTPACPAIKSMQTRQTWGSSMDKMSHIHPKRQSQRPRGMEKL
jgi:hypothetical protein